MNVKQVIVMRKKFADSDGKPIQVPLGKYLAQLGHGTMAFLSEKLRKKFWLQSIFNYFGYRIIPLSNEERMWIDGIFTKIVCEVELEQDLLDLYNQAKEAGLNVVAIRDAGLTTFNNVETLTCIAIGPHLPEKIDPLTRHLKLLRKI